MDESCTKCAYFKTGYSYNYCYYRDTRKRLSYDVYSCKKFKPRYEKEAVSINIFERISK